MTSHVISKGPASAPRACVGLSAEPRLIQSSGNKAEAGLSAEPEIRFRLIVSSSCPFSYASVSALPAREKVRARSRKGAESDFAPGTVQATSALLSSDSLVNAVVTRSSQTRCDTVDCRAILPNGEARMHARGTLAVNVCVLVCDGKIQCPSCHHKTPGTTLAMW